jgi:alpha-L-fucosidase
VRYLANCVVRNMVLLVSVGPDRHGTIPDLEQKRLREMGDWVAKMGEAIYSTRGGPWEPVDKQYGYCYKGSVVYVHLLKEYAGNTFKMPPLGALRVKKVFEVYTGRSLPYEGDQAVTIRDIDRTASPADTVVAVVFDAEIRSVWKQAQ